MSINASQFRFPPPTSTPRAQRFTQRCPPPRVSSPLQRPSFKPVRFPRHPAPPTLNENPPQGNSQVSHPSISTASSSTKRKDHPEDVQDLRSKIPRLEFKDKDPTPCNLDQQFDEIDQQNGLSDLPDHNESPTSDPIAVPKEGEASSEEEKEYIPDPDDFPGTLYDLLDEVDDVIEVSWTKSPSVTKNFQRITPHIYTDLQILKWHNATKPIPPPPIIYMCINIYILGESRQIYIVSCLVVVSNVVNACFIVIAFCENITFSFQLGLGPWKRSSNQKNEEKKIPTSL